MFQKEPRDSWFWLSLWHSERGVIAISLYKPAYPTLGTSLLPQKILACDRRNKKLGFVWKILALIKLLLAFHTWFLGQNSGLVRRQALGTASFLVARSFPRALDPVCSSLLYSSTTCCSFSLSGRAGRASPRIDTAEQLAALPWSVTARHWQLPFLCTGKRKRALVQIPPEHFLGRSSQMEGSLIFSNHRNIITVVAIWYLDSL